MERGETVVSLTSIRELLHTVKALGIPDTVCWDFDGVIADTEPLQRETYKLVLRDRGIIPSEAVFAGLIGRNEPFMWAHLSGIFRLKEPFEVLRSERRMLYEELARTQVKPAWYVQPLLDYFAEVGAKQYIVSAINLETLEDLLTYWNLQNAFAEICGFQPEAPNSRIKDGMLQTYLAASKLSIVVEDNPDFLRAAKMLGARTIGVRHSLNTLEQSDADLLVAIEDPSSMEEPGRE
jgi:beta-phosphoglucomutase-like phosphatase (HAD superfamily)